MSAMALEDSFNVWENCSCDVTSVFIVWALRLQIINGKPQLQTGGKGFDVQEFYSVERVYD